MKLLKKQNYLFVIIAVWFFASFYNISSRDLWSAGETREAEIAQEMLRSGNYIIPKFNGKFLAWKPPLFHWAETFFSIFTGFKVDSLSSRLPSSIIFLIGAIFIFASLRKYIDEDTSFLSAIITLTSFKFLWMSRVAQIDAMFSVLIGISFLFFISAYIKETMENQDSPSLIMFFHITSALSVLAKGPAGAILIGGSILLFLIIEKNLSYIKKLLTIRGIILFIIISSAWYIAVLIAEGKSFAYEFFINQNIRRFLNAFDHRHPFYYYIPQFLGGFFPWSIFFLFSILYFKFPKSQHNEKTTLYRFMLSAFLFIFLFFSISTSKRGVYILPLYIPSAVITALFLTEKSEKQKKHFLISSLLTTLIIIVISVLIYALQNELFRNNIYEKIQPFLSEFDRIMFKKIGALIKANKKQFEIYALFTAITSVSMLFLSITKKSKTYIFALVLYITISVVFSTHTILPFLNKERSLKPFALKIEKNLPKIKKIYSFGIGNEDLVYYSRKKIIPLEDITKIGSILLKEEKLYLFTDTKYEEQIKEQYNANTLFSTGIKQLDGILMEIKK